MFNSFAVASIDADKSKNASAESKGGKKNIKFSISDFCTNRRSVQNILVCQYPAHSQENLYTFLIPIF